MCMWIRTYCILVYGFNVKTYRNACTYKYIYIIIYIYVYVYIQYGKFNKSSHIIWVVYPYPQLEVLRFLVFHMNGFYFPQMWILYMVPISNLCCKTSTMIDSIGSGYGQAPFLPVLGLLDCLSPLEISKCTRFFFRPNRCSRGGVHRAHVRLPGTHSRFATGSRFAGDLWCCAVLFFGVGISKYWSL